MASVALTAFARLMLETAVTNGGGATYEQLRDFRRKTPTDQTVKTFVTYGLLEKRGAGYVITAAGLLASTTGFYETKWGSSPPEPDEFVAALCDAIAPKIATARMIVGKEFVKQLTDKATARHKAHPYPSGVCEECHKIVMLSDLTVATEWKCKVCRAPDPAG
jgi:hypothetical protein